MTEEQLKVDIKRTMEELKQDRLNRLSNCWEDPRERFNREDHAVSVHVITGILAFLIIIVTAVFYTCYDKL